MPVLSSFGGFSFLLVRKLSGKYVFRRVVAQEGKPQRRMSFDGRRMAGPFPFRFFGVLFAWGCASVFGATDAFAVGFVGKRFGVMARSLSEIAPVRSGGRNDEVQVEGRIPVDGTIRSFGGRLPVFSRLRAAGPAKPCGSNAEARCIGERSNRTGLGGRQASSAHGRSGHLCRGRKGRNARSGFGGAWSAGEECMPALSRLRESAVFELCGSSGESEAFRSLRPGNFVRFRWGDGHRNLFNPMQNTIFGTFFGLRNFSPLRLRTNPSDFGADGRKTRAGKGRAGPGYGTNDRQNRL